MSGHNPSRKSSSPTQRKKKQKTVIAKPTEETKGQKRKRAESASEKKGKKKIKLTQYVFDQKLKPPAKRKNKKDDQYFLTLNPRVKRILATRLERITQQAPPGAAAPWEETLRQIYRVGKAAGENTDYPFGKGNGQSKMIEILGVEIDIRMDKTEKGIWPRVSQHGQADKDTQALANAIDRYRDQEVARIDMSDLFLGGVRGESFADLVKRAGFEEYALDDGDKALLQQAYADGVEARAVAILSDFMDYPGNSALAEEMLQTVNSIEDYKHLFIGKSIGNEQSYGALPSQNQTSALEGDQERTGAYNTMGKLFSTGEVMISATNAGWTNGRKMISMLTAKPDLFTVEKRSAGESQDQKFDNDQFVQLVHHQAIDRRDQTQANAAYRGVNAFSDDEGSDIELEKLETLSPTRQEQRIERFRSNAEEAVGKFGALIRSAQPAPDAIDLSDLLLITSQRAVNKNLSPTDQRRLEELLRKANGIPSNWANF